MNARSIRFRLIGWYAGLLIGIFLLCSAGVYQFLSHSMRQNLAEALRRRSEQVTALLVTGVPKTGEAYLAEQIEERYAPANYDRYIRVTRADGRVVYASGRAASFDPRGLPAISGHQATQVATLPDGNHLLLVISEKAGYRIESGGPMQPIEAVLSHLLFLLALGIPVVLLVAVAGGHILVGQALRPVLQMAHSAEQISLHNLSETLPTPATADELEQLSLALNTMIARMREAFAQNRRFLADASHELRTPLTILRGELEYAVEQSRAVPELRDKIGSALEEVERLSKIVQTLFAISRLDAGEARQEWIRFDLARLASSTAEQMSVLAEDKGIAIECEAGTEIGVEGDSARIKQVVVNLLDNAIKYTPDGGKVQLTVMANNNCAVLEVADTGIGIPSVALPHVFERFFRVDKARSRDAGGAGLGLAIVKSICAAHGGEVSVQSTEGQGSRFKVELPLAK